VRFVRIVCLLAALGSIATSCSGEPAYARLRQRAEEEVPGTWGLSLKPPPGDLDPAVGPRRAAALAFRIEPEGEVFETLALVPGSFVGSADDTVAWVVFARNVCFAQSKGDLVSSSRRDPEDVDRCSASNVWVEMIDPMTGESLASLGAYDESGQWLPLRGA
jgi:hypothetical protein